MGYMLLYFYIWWVDEVYKGYMGLNGGIWWYMMGIWFDKFIYDICMRDTWKYMGIDVDIWLLCEGIEDLILGYILLYVDIWWVYEVYKRYMGVDGGIWLYMMAKRFDKLI